MSVTRRYRNFTSRALCLTVFFAALCCFMIAMSKPVHADGWTLVPITHTGSTSFSNPTTSVSSTFTAVFNWQSSTHAPPPTTAYFLVSPSANWRGVFQSGVTPNATADDGFGDTSSMTQFPNGQWLGSSSGYHLLQRSGSSGSVTITDTPFVIVNWVQFSGGTGGLSMTAVPDTRGLTISTTTGANAKCAVVNSSGVTETDAYGNITYAPGPHQNDGDGTGHGDIGLPNVTPGYEVAKTVTYTGNRVGGWTVDGDTDHWNDSVSNTSLADRLTYLSPDISPFTVTYAEPDTTSSSSGSLGTGHVFLSYYSGSDGAEATANFYMTVHNLAEFHASGGPNGTFIQQPPLTISSPGYAIENGSIGCNWDVNNVLEADFTNAAAGVFTVVGAYYGGWMGALLSAASIGASALTPTPGGSSAVLTIVGPTLARSLIRIMA